MKYVASRLRREFGAPIAFQDRPCDPSTAAEKGLSASYLECSAYEDKNFTAKRSEQESSVQAVPMLVEGASQTEWYC